MIYNFVSCPWMNAPGPSQRAHELLSSDRMNPSWQEQSPLADKKLPAPWHLTHLFSDKTKSNKCKLSLKRNFTVIARAFISFQEASFSFASNAITIFWLYVARIADAIYTVEKLPITIARNTSPICGELAFLFAFAFPLLRQITSRSIASHTLAFWVQNAIKTRASFGSFFDWSARAWALNTLPAEGQQTWPFARTVAT